MKKLKRLVSITLICILTICSASIVANAANTADTTWTFFFGSQSTQYTPLRSKDNTTKIYFKRTDGLTAYNFRAKVYGAKSATGTKVDCSNGIYYVINATTSPHYLTNYVREWGYTYASVCGYSPSGALTASGVWSPDNSSGI